MEAVRPKEPIRMATLMCWGKQHNSPEWEGGHEEHIMKKLSLTGQTNRRKQIQTHGIDHFAFNMLLSYYHQKDRHLTLFFPHSLHPSSC